MDPIETYKDKVSGETLYVVTNPDNNTIKYYKDIAMTIVHRVDGPAIIFDHNSESYYQNNIRHRMDGPAIIAWGTEFWWVNGVELDKDRLTMMLQKKL
jgi:hypothetical protein